jgi:hypothetical protein
MVVTYKVSYSNSNDSDEFSWTLNVPDSVNKIFPLCLKKLLHFKKRQVFLAHPVYRNEGHENSVFDDVNGRYRCGGLMAVVQMMVVILGFYTM